MKHKFVNQQLDITWVFLEDDLKAIGSYINRFGEPTTDVKQHESEEDFKKHLDTVERSNDFRKAKI